MKNAIRLTVVTLLAAGFSLSADTLYVGPGGYPSIEDAVNVAATGDLVSVTNGVFGSTTISKMVTVRSINGPQVTAINGSLWVSGGPSLSGFALMNGDNNGSVVLGLATAATNAFLTNCIISGGHYAGGNGADGLGGGAFGCTLYNCLVTNNYASYGGGGAAFCTLYNCTLAGNSSIGWGGGAYSCTLYNCIVCSNTAGFGPSRDYYESDLYSCWTADPQFVDYANGDLHLQSNSPCINAGNNAFVYTTKDLDGRARIKGGTVDIGAYECQAPALLAYYTWAQAYGLPTDSSAVYADADGDGMNNWQEWVCGTCPTNPLSALRLVSAAPVGTDVKVSWQSVAGASYFLARSANLASPSTLLATNILGQAGTTTYTDTNAAGAGSFFYRVGVNCP